MTDILVKNERKWIVKNDNPQLMAQANGVLAIINEIHTEDPQNPTLFIFRSNIEPWTRPMLIQIKDLIETVLKDAPESRIIPVPPGARLPRAPQKV